MSDENCETSRPVSMTRENVEGEMTADERITHERTGHATYDPSCETCLKVRGVTTHPRKAVAEAVRQSEQVNNVQKSRSWSLLDLVETRLRAVHLKGAKIRRS